MSIGNSFRLHRTAALRRPARGGQLTGPVSVIKVNIAVWREALRLAGHDRSRLRVIDASTVVVVNRPASRQP
jgi:hypothetical protein